MSVDYLLHESSVGYAVRIEIVESRSQELMNHLDLQSWHAA